MMSVRITKYLYYAGGKRDNMSMIEFKYKTKIRVFVQLKKKWFN